MILSEEFYGLVQKYLSYPKEAQLDILQEECAELIQAISKLKRSKPQALEQMKEEITHVLLSIHVVSAILDITSKDIDEEVRKKL